MAFDNLCKYLAETYPEQFAEWLLGEYVGELEVLKTELQIEPVRADSVTFLRGENLLLHLEFQVEPESRPSLPLRMLDYWVRLYRRYEIPVHQIIVFLKPTELEIPTEFRSANTWHQYQILKMWEQDPQILMQNEGTLPLAVLGRQRQTAETLLEAVAKRISEIREKTRRVEIFAQTQIFAGLRYNKNLIKQLLSEDIMKESVIYQDIIQKGVRQGIRQGKQSGIQEGEQKIVLRLLERQIGKLDEATVRKIRRFSQQQTESLGEALLDFKSRADLNVWLKNAEPENGATFDN